MEKLFVVYQPKFQAAKFVIDGIVLENVKPIPLNLQGNRCSYVLYGIFLFLHMFRLAYLFRYTRETRKLLLDASKGKILFWDCCGVKEYRLMNWRFRKAIGKNIFLWNPLSRWNPDENGIKRSIQYLKSKNFRVYSFDACDASRYQLFRMKNVNRKVSFCKESVLYDFYFLGYAKKRRASIDALKVTLEEKGFRTHFMLIDKKEDYVSHMENIRKSVQARCIVDIISSEQYGLSLRPFDALFLRKKLITNCSAIEKMDFYHPSNIYIIRDSNLEGLEEFMRMPYRDIDAEIVNQYEVNHWLRNFLKNAVRE